MARSAGLTTISFLAVVLGASSQAAAAERCVARAEVQGMVTTATAEYLEGALAKTGSCQLLLIRLNTPGGQLDATQRIATLLLEARSPVVVYVAPGAARAGSAGVFITLAAHVAAMAPAARIGAAHPVVGLGKDPEEAGGKHLADKIENDTAAFARSIAQRRGRNVEWAEAAVRRSVSATADEAVSRNIVDRVATSERELLDWLHGRTVKLDKGWRTLATEGAEIRPVAMTLRQRTVSVLAHPGLTFLLVVVGVLGILVELSSPGLIIPGSLGAFALLLAAIGLNVLPVNVAGVVLLLLALALFVTELLVASYGLLAVAGVVCLVIGSLLFIDTSDPKFFADATVRLSLRLVLPLAGLVAAGAGLLTWKLARERRRPTPTGVGGLVGSVGEAATTISSAGGRVRLGGERWSARAERPIPAGARIRVVGIDGLVLKVAPVEK